jgi:YrbI family 3-deoxy-D-manno-octulosonate 8-phosphate phosphatase
MLKHVYTDFDGVLTDGKYYYFMNGTILDRAVSWNANDSIAIKLFKERGIDVSVITSTSNPSIVFNRCDQLGIEMHHALPFKKLDCLKNLVNDLDSIAYIGDSIDDIPCLEEVKYSFVPNNAFQAVKNHSNIWLNKSSGEGCLLETYIYFFGDKF